MNTILLAFEPETVPDTVLATVKELAPEMRILVTNDREEIEGLLGEIEVTVGGFPPDLVSKASNLRWYQQMGAGADWLMRHPEAVQHDFVLTNASGVHAIPIAEHILGFLLAFGRGLHRAVRAQERGEWARQYLREDLFELVGKTMVLVGLGSIGSRTAKLASALGVRVLGVRRNAEIQAPDVQATFGPKQLLDLLPEADFLVLAMPLTHETQGMIGERELRAMKPTSYVVNIGRGGTIQEAVLARALEEGWIAGAGLDVFESEPLAADSPLWEMENVIITAHYAGATPHYQERAMGIFLANLRRYQASETLYNVVDKEVGY